MLFRSSSRRRFGVNGASVLPGKEILVVFNARASLEMVSFRVPGRSCGRRGKASADPVSHDGQVEPVTSPSFSFFRMRKATFDEIRLAENKYTVLPKNNKITHDAHDDLDKVCPGIRYKAVSPLERAVLQKI